MRHDNKAKRGLYAPPPEGKDWECLGTIWGNGLGPWPRRLIADLLRGLPAGRCRCRPFPIPVAALRTQSHKRRGARRPIPTVCGVLSLGPADRTGRGLSEGEGGLPVLPSVANPAHQNGAEGWSGGPTERWASTGQSIPTNFPWPFQTTVGGEGVQPTAVKKASGYGGEKK